MVRVPSAHRAITVVDTQAAGYMCIVHDVPVAVVARHLGVSPRVLARRMRMLRDAGWLPAPPPQAVAADRVLETLFFPGTPIEEATKYLFDAQSSIDLCVYVLTCDQLAGAVVNAAACGVAVRVLTDAREADRRGSRVNALQNAGIPVHCIPATSSLMHHKFCVIDRIILMNGSMNWSQNAHSSNVENVQVHTGASA